MNIATALLDRLVPGRGDGDDDTPPKAQRTTPPEPKPEPEHGADPEEGESPRIADEDVSEEALVLRKLIAHGGRVRRSTLVSETGWPEEELDDVLREMEADAQISTIRRRDPLVCRRGFEPAGAPLRFKND